MTKSFSYLQRFKNKTKQTILYLPVLITTVAGERCGSRKCIRQHIGRYAPCRFYVQKRRNRTHTGERHSLGESQVRTQIW